MGRCGPSISDVTSCSVVCQVIEPFLTDGKMSRNLGPNLSSFLYNSKNGEYDVEYHHYVDEYPDDYLEYLQYQHPSESSGEPPKDGGCPSSKDNADEYPEKDDFYDCHDEANRGRAKPHEMVAFMCYRIVLCRFLQVESCEL